MPFVLRDVAHDGTTISVFVKKRKFAFQKIEYGDTIEGAEFETSIGFFEQGAQTTGKYKTTPAKVTMLRAEWDRMMAYMPKNGYTLVILNSTITYQHPALGKATDKLSRCRITSNKISIESGGKAAMVEFDMTIGQIYWNGKTINKLADQPAGVSTI